MSVIVQETQLGTCYAAICDEDKTHGLLAMAHVSKQWAHDVLDAHDAFKHPKKFAARKKV